MLPHQTGPGVDEIILTESAGVVGAQGALAWCAENVTRVGSRVWLDSKYTACVLGDLGQIH